MNDIRLLKSDIDRVSAMERLLELMDMDPEDGTSESDELELLAVLIDRYESEQYPIQAPSPIEAIKFRMDQLGLKNKDLVQYIGSAPRVSEVLNGKRKLSLKMIRNLSLGLEISADVLIQDSVQRIAVAQSVSGDEYPLKEMLERGYFDSFSGKLSELKDYADEYVSSFFSSLSNGHDLRPAMLKTTAHKRSNDKIINEYALAAWQAKVLKEFASEGLAANYQSEDITKEWMIRLAQLSWSDNGPLLAKEYLNRSGIGLIVEPHLPCTYLDGAVCVSESGNPVVALTLRYDKLDSFWFTLMHEIAHLALHIRDVGAWFVDNLDALDGDELETQADELARDSLIPMAEWQKFIDQDANAVRDFAKRLSISPSIIAGRVRHEKGNHSAYGKLFRDRVRQYFE